MRSTLKAALCSQLIAADRRQELCGRQQQRSPAGPPIWAMPDDRSGQVPTVMPPWRLRDFHDDDLDQAICLWDQSRSLDETHPVFGVSEVISTARCGQPAVVAVIGDDLVGMAAAQSQGERAWISVVALSSLWRNRGIGSALLGELEIRLRSMGVRRISALLPADATGAAALHNSGYSRRPATELLREDSTTSAPQMRDCWPNLGGRSCPLDSGTRWPAWKRRSRSSSGGIVLPLVGPNAARSTAFAAQGGHPVRPARYGQDQFCQGGGRSARLAVRRTVPVSAAAPDVAMAGALRDAFATWRNWTRCVVFIDEVEEIAGCRSGFRSDPAHGVTNELLKLIPAFRQHDDRLLVCATNSVRSLDSAFLRPGGSTTSSRSVRPTRWPGLRSGVGTSGR